MTTPKKPQVPRIVSSAHLVSERSAELSEFEYGLIIANNAFQRWMLHCMAVAGEKGLGAQDILVLHNVNHRERAKRLADICFALNVEDNHTVSYSLRKLMKMELVQGDRRGKEIFYSTAPKGAELCMRYRDVREQCLIASLEVLGIDNEEIGELAKVLRTLSGLYDQAARAAASL